mmetsp:Transcript_9089/g.19646  ORF Transcript_9089/g.19646 Transcript_9089/m.19646 type:complete len:104 (-) Transcript_9089:234-545(-)
MLTRRGTRGNNSWNDHDKDSEMKRGGSFILVLYFVLFIITRTEFILDAHVRDRKACIFQPSVSNGLHYSHPIVVATERSTSEQKSFCFDSVPYSSEDLSLLFV